MQRRKTRRRGIRIRLLGAAAVLVTAVLGAASCSGATSQPQGGPSSPTGSASQPAPAGSSQASASPVSCPGGWQTGPVQVTHQVTVPPVPVATGIRVGSHPECRYDRLVVDFSGPVPGYSVRFVSAVIQDGSGKNISMPGSAYLEIVFKPAQGHTDSGKLTLPTAVQATGFPMLKGYAVAGDFEGVLTIALGLAGGTKYRVGEVSGRVYVDASW